MTMGQMEDLEKRMSEMEDELEIQKLVYNYCFRQDQRDIEAFVNVLTDDIIFTFRGWALELRGKEELKKYFLEQVFATHEYHMHQVTNLNIQVDGEKADGEAYLSLRSSCGGEPQEAGIRYMLKLRKENTQWKLSEIHCEVITWKGSLTPQDQNVYERFTV
jgi:ketosteroid isomerase-like protein